MKIDLHTHILPERWPDWTAKSGYSGWVELAHEAPGCAAGSAAADGHPAGTACCPRTRGDSVTAPGVDLTRTG